MEGCAPGSGRTPGLRKHVPAVQGARRKEVHMPRYSIFVAACLAALLFGVPSHAQNSPSLGDLARQAQKNKAKEPVKKVFTNDDLTSGSSSGAGLAASTQRAAAGPAAAGETAHPATAEQAVAQLEGMINQIDALDRDTLVKNALKGVDTDFPGRDRWEQRLLNAKQIYVERGRALLENAKQIQSAAESLRGVRDPKDPRVKDLTNRLQALVREGTRSDAAFQAIILEGRDLAGQALGH
jgi:hypothetical protein